MIFKKKNNKNFQYHLNQKKIFGFWLYLMSDLILFGCLFSVYSVFSSHNIPFKEYTLNLKLPLFETIFLLLSSFCCGMATITINVKKINSILLFLCSSFIFGTIFLILEIYELNHLILIGFTPNKHSFISSFFTLIGTHSLHVIFGLLWMFILIIQIKFFEINDVYYTKIQCLNFFWHFLDIIWICIFSIIYLLGAIK